MLKSNFVTFSNSDLKVEHTFTPKQALEALQNFSS